jgi:membrane protease YdiL (CAAX protease family)
MSKKILFFLIICFAIPVPCAVLSRALGRSAVAFALFGIEAASPSIAAILTAFVFAGSCGLKDFLARCYLVKNRARTLSLALVALAIPLAVGCCAKLANAILAHGTGEFLGHPGARRIIILCWALVAEEQGWRGFLQPEFSARAKRKILAPLAIGCVWALWHYHFYWTGSIDVPAGIFLAGCVGESYVYNSLTAHSDGNIVPATLWHFAGNLALALFAVNPEANGGSVVPYSIYTALMCAIGIACLAREFAPHEKARRKAGERRIHEDDSSR